MEDKRLLRLIKKARLGNKDAFCELIEIKSRKIIFTAVNIMGNKSDGEDAAQEAVITLAKKIGTLKKPELFDAWMYRIIFNVCMDEKRKLARKPDASADMDVAAAIVAEKDPEVIPEQKLTENVEKEAIMAALNELPDRYRMCMILYYYEDMSYSEIAETLSVSEQVVANTLNRAKEKLRESLGDVDIFAAKPASGNLPATAVKAGIGMAVPMALISEAMIASEAAVVAPSSVAALSSAAAAVTMPSGLLLTRFVDGVASKIVAGAACVAVVAGVSAVAAQNPPVKVVEEAPAPITQPAPSEENSSYQYATVEGLPEGASTTIISAELNAAELESFKQQSAGYTFVSSMSDSSYDYNLYQSLENELEYVLTIEPLS